MRCRKYIIKGEISICADNEGNETEKDNEDAKQYEENLIQDFKESLRALCEDLILRLDHAHAYIKMESEEE